MKKELALAYRFVYGMSAINLARPSTRAKHGTGLRLSLSKNMDIPFSVIDWYKASVPYNALVLLLGRELVDVLRKRLIFLAVLFLLGHS